MKIRQTLVKQRSGAQIALSIHEAIRKGELKPGDKLCSESELARKYSGSVYSVRQATRQLKEQGVTKSELLAKIEELYREEDHAED